jgi:hypothetical protein
MRKGVVFLLEQTFHRKTISIFSLNVERRMTYMANVEDIGMFFTQHNYNNRRKILNGKQLTLG